MLAKVQSVGRHLTRIIGSVRIANCWGQMNGGNLYMYLIQGNSHAPSNLVLHGRPTGLSFKPWILEGKRYMYV